MKWLIILVLFSACSMADKLKTELDNPVLTIKNQSLTDLIFVKWIDNYGNSKYYSPDSGMYSAYTGLSNNYGMRYGSEYTTDVKAATGRIYFRFSNDASSTQYWTAAEYTLTNGGNYTITLTGSTLITH